MQRYYFSLLLFLSCLFSVFTTYGNSYRVLPEKIQKSDNDYLQYQVIELDNHMRVLLVSDPNAIKSLGDITVSVGSLHDPTEQQGLAHYTEHMVLMGSKHYPESNSFSEFLNKHAGNYNASTALTRTSYYFEVENEALPEGLTRLADALAHPLLKKNYSRKERNAINQEATLARSNDGFRIQQVDSETINPKHPASLFSVGNLCTLSDKKSGSLHGALVSFYHHYYSANLMTGIIYGKGSLNALAKLAVGSFGRIVNTEKQVEPITESALPKQDVGKIIYMEPAQPKRVLYLQFPIENNKNFKDKSDEYIAYLLGNQSEGTLANLLVKQGLIDGIHVSSDPKRYGNSGDFNIIFNLTSEGLAQRDSVIAAVFNYIHLIEEKGIDIKYYQEIQNILQLNFKYQHVSRNMDYIEWLADQILLYPIAHILNADYTTTKFNPEKIQKRLAQLRPDNARIWIIAPNQAYNKKSYFIHTGYRVERITAAEKNRWQQSSALTTAMKLPDLNPFIATDFSLVKSAKATTHNSFDPTGNLLYFPSRYFEHEPKAAFILALKGNYVTKTPKQQIMLSMLNYLASRAMTRLQYQAGMAGMALYQTEGNGLTLTAIGYSQYLPEMLNAMLLHYKNLKISDNDMILAKSWYQQQLDTANNVSSYAIAMQPITALNSIPYYDRDLRKKLVPGIKGSELIRFRDDLFSKTVPYLLAIGNVDKNHLNDVYDHIKSSLSDKIRFTIPMKLSIPSTGNVVFDHNSSHSDSALGLIYLPVKGGLAVHAKAKSLVLTQIISSWFYKQLRSEEQLGYALFTFPVSVGHANGFGFLIQSNQRTPEYIYGRYRSFFLQALLRLITLPESDFDQYKEGIVSELKENPQTFEDEVSTYRYDFDRLHFAFDSKKKLIAAVMALNKRETVNFYRRLIFDNEGFSIVSQVFGSKYNAKKENPQGYLPYSNVAELQKVWLQMDKQGNQK